MTQDAMAARPASISWRTLRWACATVFKELAMVSPLPGNAADGAPRRDRCRAPGRISMTELPNASFIVALAAFLMVGLSLTDQRAGATHD